MTLIELTANGHMWFTSPGCPQGRAAETFHSVSTPPPLLELARFLVLYPILKALSRPCSFTVHSDFPSRFWHRGLGEVLAVKFLTLLLSLLISSPFQSPLPYKNPSTVLGILKIKEGGRQKKKNDGKRGLDHLPLVLNSPENSRSI